MRRMILFLTGLLLLTAAALFAAKVSPRARYHYELRDDLHIHFSNTDAVIEAIRQGLRCRDDTIIVNYCSHSNNMDEISEIVRELMQYAAAETDRPDEGDYILHQYGGYEMQYSLSTTIRFASCRRFIQTGNRRKRSMRRLLR